MIRRLLSLAALAVAALFGWRAFGPSAISPLAWQAPEAPPLTGRYATNHRLAHVQRFPTGAGPETLSFDREGRVYAGLLDGRLIRLSTDDGKSEELANTGGRPLGVAFDAKGRLIVADATRGLLAIDESGKPGSLARDVVGTRIGLANMVAIGPLSGRLYFSDSSTRWPTSYSSDLLEHRASGRLLAYDPATGKTAVLLGDLHFANGVVVAPDESFVLVAETNAYRITRLWLSGAKAGQHEVFVDNLPGFPDDITFNGKDRIWIALPGSRDPQIDALAPKPMLRRLLAALPGRLQGAFRTHQPSRAFVLAVDLDGQVVANLQDDSTDAYAPVTCAVEHDGWLYLGSLSAAGIARLPLAEALGAAPAS